MIIFKHSIKYLQIALLCLVFSSSLNAEIDQASRIHAQFTALLDNYPTYDAQVVHNIDRAIQNTPEVASVLAQEALLRFEPIPHSDYALYTMDELYVNNKPLRENCTAILANLPSLAPALFKAMLERTPDHYRYDLDHCLHDATIVKHIVTYLDENPSATYRLTFDTFYALTRIMNESDCLKYKGLVRILAENVLNDEIFTNSARSGGDLIYCLEIILHYYGNSSLTQACIKKAIETENSPLWSMLHSPFYFKATYSNPLYYFTKGFWLKGGILNSVTANPTILATIPIQNALLISEHIQLTPEMINIMGKRVIENNNLDHAMPILLKTLLCESTVKDAIIKQTYDNVGNIADDNLKVIHECMTSEQQKKLEAIAHEQLKNVLNHTANIVEKALVCHSSFSFLTQCENQATTATEGHFCANKAIVITMLKRLCTKIVPKTRAMILDMFKKEQEEMEKGNYVFYHAQEWQWHFKADIFKQFMNLIRPSTKIGDDYQFLRFNYKPRDYSVYVRDVLFMNSALFGNASRSGACSLYFLLNNRDFSRIDDANLNSDDWMRPHFMLYYKRHQSEFNELYRLHSQASEYGNCLLISIPSDKVDTWVYTTEPDAKPKTIGTKYWWLNLGFIKLYFDKSMLNTKTILDTVRTNPDQIRENDCIEYALILEGDVLDPQDGPRIYAFNCADSARMAEYYTKRDQLFAIIRQEMDQEKS